MLSEGTLQLLGTSRPARFYFAKPKAIYYERYAEDRNTVTEIQ